MRWRNEEALRYRDLLLFSVIVVSQIVIAHVGEWRRGLNIHKPTKKTLKRKKIREDSNGPARRVAGRIGWNLAGRSGMNDARCVRWMALMMR